MDDSIVAYLKKLNIPVTRENYIAVNWMGDYPADEPLPAELEASLPKELQWDFE
jgi:hypothetical protein